LPEQWGEDGSPAGVDFEAGCIIVGGDLRKDEVDDLLREVW
jgi:hypothetical protein